MLNSLRIQNFKSWQDTGTIQFGAITGFFGTNSSGKTSILQFLLMLKQTVESSDRAQVLNLGDERSYVELGTMHDIIHDHKDPSQLLFSFEWQEEPGQQEHNGNIYSEHTLYKFSAIIQSNKSKIELNEFTYEVNQRKYNVFKREKEYFLNTETKLGHSFGRNPIGKPDKFYNISLFRNDNFIESELDIPNSYLSFNYFFDSIYYLGPLRDVPRRLYIWGGGRTEDVGKYGEKTIAALLIARDADQSIPGPLQNLEEHVAYWLKELGLIHSFEVRPIAPNRKEYEVRIKRTAESAEVFLTDVGFGVSQILPVLVLLLMLRGLGSLRHEQRKQ